MNVPQEDINNQAKARAKKAPIDYRKSKIYRIINGVNDIVYIGATTQILCKRFDCHKLRTKGNDKHCKSKLYDAMREIGVNQFQIFLIEDFPCGSKAALDAREYEITNGYARDKLYNSMFDGKATEEMKAKQSKHQLLITPRGEESHRFNRGCVQHEVSQRRYRFRWTEAGTKKIKNFSYRLILEEEAKKLCVEYQNEIYPLLEEKVLQN